MASPSRAPEPLAPLLDRLADARANTDALFERIAPAALYDRPIPERHRLIFYLGHLEAFDWNLLGRGAFDLAPENAAFDKLFAFGIDPVGSNLPTDTPSDWPKERAVRRYVAGLREKLDSKLAEAFTGPEPSREVAGGTLVHVAIEHRLMHAETLAYLLHQLPYDRKQADRLRVARPIGVERLTTVQIPEGDATLGTLRHPDGVTGHTADPASPFGWDNEFESITAHVPAFGIGAYPVTNGEFLEFVRSAGYSDQSLWGDEDWALEIREGPAVSISLGRGPRRLELPRNVRRISAAAKCSGLRQPRGSFSLRPLGRQIAAHRSAMAPRRLRHARCNRTRLPLGQRAAGSLARQF